MKSFSIGTQNPLDIGDTASKPNYTYSIGKNNPILNIKDDGIRKDWECTKLVSVASLCVSNLLQELVRYIHGLIMWT